MVDIYLYHQPFFVHFCFCAFLEYYFIYVAASLCKGYQNVVATSSPRYDFEAVIRKIGPWMQVFAGYNLCHVLANTVLILFWGKSRNKISFKIGIALALVGIMASVGASIVVFLVSSEWNNINNSGNSFYHLHRSVFIGNISQIQLSLNIQFILGWAIFMPISLYLLFFWGKILLLERERGLVKIEETYKTQIEKTKEDETIFVQMENIISKVEKK